MLEWKALVSRRRLPCVRPRPIPGHQQSRWSINTFGRRHLENEREKQSKVTTKTQIKNPGQPGYEKKSAGVRKKVMCKYVFLETMDPEEGQKKGLPITRFFVLMTRFFWKYEKKDMAVDWAI